MNNNKTSKKIYDSKIVWMIVSLIISIIIWSYVSSQQSVEITRTFSGVDVEFVGVEEIYEQYSLSIAEVNTDNVTIVIKGSRNNIGNLSASDIRAVIDVSRITQPNDMTWAYDIIFPSGVDTGDITYISRTPENISFKVVKNASKEIEVKGTFDGHVADGCTAADELVFSPSTITVSGPEEQLREVEYAWVSFGREEEIDATYTVDSDFVLKNSAGDVVSTEGLELSTDKVTVTQPILKTKEVKLAVNLIDGGGIKAEDCSVSVTPSTIMIEADTRIIDTIDSIVIAEYKLSDLTSDYIDSVAIPEKEGIKVLDEVSSAAVKITLPKTYERSFTVSNIVFDNVTAGYEAESLDEAVTVTLRSSSSAVLDAISASDIKIIVDLADNNTTTGNVEKKAYVQVEGAENVGLIGDLTVRVNITKVN